MDNIGVPQGVPNKFKLAHQIAAGFENIPLIAAIFPITPNKNVDRIYYIHYNVQHLSNLTCDAVEGLASQLAATSLMAYQNGPRHAAGGKRGGLFNVRGSVLHLHPQQHGP